MTTPRRRAGFRTITVDGTRWRWRVVVGRAGRLTIYGPHSDSARLVVELPGLRDGWLFIQEAHATVEPTRLTPATPAFVRAAILAGLAHGFRPEARGAELVLQFQQGAFSAR